MYKVFWAKKFKTMSTKLSKIITMSLLFGLKKRSMVKMTQKAPNL